MRIERIETLRLKEFPNLVWVEVVADDGTRGLGETFFGASAVEAYVHDWCAPRLLGRDPLAIPARRTELKDYIGWRGAGVETRALSAIDIALWDLFAKTNERPVADMLGGRARDAVRTYNTCAGYRYVRSAVGQRVSNWQAGETEGPYEDLDAFLYRADELAQSLLDQGITAMKIWPFDPAAERSGGWDITAEELKTALEPFEKIRNSVGDQMDIMVEFHSLWSPPMARRLAHELRDYGTYWHEDPFRLENLSDLKEYARHTEAMICCSETLPSIHAFREYFETGVAGVAMLDLSWCGGLSEARKIAGMAEAYGVPVAPHDCTGPVVFAASCQFSLHAPNTLIQESVRAFYTGWYRELVSGLPVVKDGMITVPDLPGHGVSLLPGLHERPDAIRRVTKE
ncbi:mandelate racemase/muconate lactonizing enzyme family protein [Ruegeria sediminis]|uniref:Mandelate racemase/muconate lactonizing enzyme family protein n=1 Tax=Ruegeria sediminis TaxID=2583820 RepID=A0ABY2WZQ7_9RHOB|nr:mandelate racemase/muconate lactonizing enzyme family protein [Ruegeria sediminis]TMV08465.1 mandelate racemase/muconate lactonizing enzyme family protein [Ruegeria sediminis]